MSLSETINTFNGGLGGGANIAFSNAMLGAFAVTISRSGITDLLAQKVIAKFGGDDSASSHLWFKPVLLTSIVTIAIGSQNLTPVHIAFIPILILPLLHVMAKFEMDRRLVACVVTFGLTVTYMLLPVGLGGIFLNNILLKNLTDNGLSQAMALPVLDMFYL